MPVVPSRFVTTQPTQALGMLNSSFVNEQAEQFAEYLPHEAGDKARVARRPRAQRLCPARTDAGRNRAAACNCCDSLQTKHRPVARGGTQAVLRHGLNLNEFMYLD